MPTTDDVDRVVGDLAVAGRTTATRREYVQIFKGFHRFLQTRKAAEIEAAFGVKLVCPVDEFNASRHVGDDSPAELPPPLPERVDEFFEFLKGRIATARGCRFPRSPARPPGPFTYEQRMDILERACARADASRPVTTAWLVVTAEA